MFFVSIRRKQRLASYSYLEDCRREKLTFVIINVTIPERMRVSESLRNAKAQDSARLTLSAGRYIGSTAARSPARNPINRRQAGDERRNRRETKRIRSRSPSAAIYSAFSAMSSFLHFLTLETHVQNCQAERKDENLSDSESVRGTSRRLTLGSVQIRHCDF